MGRGEGGQGQVRWRQQQTAGSAATAGQQQGSSRSSSPSLTRFAGRAELDKRKSCRVRACHGAAADGAAKGKHALDLQGRGEQRAEGEEAADRASAERGRSGRSAKPGARSHRVRGRVWRHASHHHHAVERLWVGGRDAHAQARQLRSLQSGRRGWEAGDGGAGVRPGAAEGGDKRGSDGGGGLAGGRSGRPRDGRRRLASHSSVPAGGSV